jgi:hypothetical protein
MISGPVSPTAKMSAHRSEILLVKTGDVSTDTLTTTGDAAIGGNQKTSPEPMP